ncbi:putative membrane protein [Bacteriovorax sp. BSW11_IV]|uniref:hypothetical protein n=1 Tax=Bacteriovorax sp. BSW11_IV TaxID=1353529 RepID=UPI00038A115C|nr:hypothetical protein [Bacteriovorax sp. BSW11_IV]EQC47925.1 putative membrane protein [Bacteriovorax sp. BSW11_IV]
MINVLILSIILLMASIAFKYFKNEIANQVIWAICFLPLLVSPFVDIFPKIEPLNMLMVVLLFVLGVLFSKKKSNVLMATVLVFLIPQIQDIKIFYFFVGLASLIHYRYNEGIILSFYFFGLSLYSIIFPTQMVANEFNLFMLLLLITVVFVVIKSVKNVMFFPVFLLAIIQNFNNRNIATSSLIYELNWVILLILIVFATSYYFRRKNFDSLLVLTTCAIMANTTGSQLVLNIMVLSSIYLVIKDEMSEDYLKYVNIVFSLLLLVSIFNIPMFVPLSVMATIIIMMNVTKEDRCLV